MRLQSVGKTYGRRARWVKGSASAAPRPTGREGAALPDPPGVFLPRRRWEGQTLRATPRVESFELFASACRLRSRRTRRAPVIARQCHAVQEDGGVSARATGRHPKPVGPEAEFGQDMVRGGIACEVAGAEHAGGWICEMGGEQGAGALRLHSPGPRPAARASNRGSGRARSCRMRRCDRRSPRPCPAGRCQESCGSPPVGKNAAPP